MTSIFKVLNTILATVIITVIMIIVIISMFNYFYSRNIANSESQIGKIDAVLAVYTAREIDSGLDNIRFKYKREEDVKEIALAEKKAKETAKKKAAKEAAEKKAAEDAAEKKEKERQIAQIKQIEKEAAAAEAKVASKKKKAEKEKEESSGIRTMSLKELNSNGHIQKLCDKYNMSKVWFDRISTTESSYGVYFPAGSYNAWGWGIYDDRVLKLGDNWYDSSERFIQAFMRLYGNDPDKSDMRRYCPSGAYDKYF